MNVLVLGGTGFVGREIIAALRQLPGVTPIAGARRSTADHGVEYRQLDATDAQALAAAAEDVDVIVNCVTGSGASITANARAVVEAARRSARVERIIHMSSMAVYGTSEGVVTEDSPVGSGCNWYGEAKIAAEEELRRCAPGAGVAILRIGCVYGPGSPLWLDRLGLLLRARRLGDLGAAGDGWSNLVHVRDIGKAVGLLLGRDEMDTVCTYNLAAPDSPRWNRYFADLARGIGCTPLPHKSRVGMLAEGYVVAPPLKVLERLGFSPAHAGTPIPSIPPSLLGLWAQQIRIESSALERATGIEWTPYSEGLRECVQDFNRRFDR